MTTERPHCTGRILARYQPDIVSLDAPESWTEQALCAQVGGDEWFPDRQGQTVPDAVAICGRCPVRAQCLEYAITNDERYGVWGGLGTAARDRVKAGGVA